MLDRNHVFSDLYYKDKTPGGENVRYKVYWGGRGAAKSWAIAEALVRKAAEGKLLIVCIREFQNSLDDSSKRLIRKTIQRLGLAGWFDLSKPNMPSKSGSEFLFKGCHPDPDKLRSLEDADIFWLEEAHAISENSWRVLIPTLRKPGSQIWVSYNMNEENDATHVRLVTSPGAKADIASGRAIVHLVNYDSNPYFASTELQRDMERDRANDYELYEHIWLGRPKRRSNAIVLNGKYRIATLDEFPDDLWTRADQKRLRFGADFGYAEDPATLTRTFTITTTERRPDFTGDPATVAERETRRLYVEYEAWGQHVETSDLKDFYDRVPGSRNWPIGADASRPETISAVRRDGFNIYAAEKWPGSVEDGIAYLRSFYEIVIHPRCVKAAEEAYAWRWKVDPKVVDATGQPMVLPVLKPGNEHIWDSVRYGHDGEIQRGGTLGVWARLAAEAPR